MNMDGFDRFLDEAEQWNAKSKETWQRVNRRAAVQLIGATQHLLSKTPQSFTKRDYALIDDLIAFCQFPFRDKQSTDDVLDALMSLYDPLIANITRQFCWSFKIRNQFDDWKRNAQMVFRRLITGDMPDTIEKHLNDSTQRADRTLETEVFVSDKHIAKLRQQRQKEFDKHLQDLTNIGVEESELVIVKMMFDDIMRHYPEWAAINPRSISLEEYVRSLLIHELEVARRLALQSPVQGTRDRFAAQVTAIEEHILNTPENFAAFLSKNKEACEAYYKAYQQKAYRNNFYRKGRNRKDFLAQRGMTFTNYIQKYLPLALKDIFKSAAYKKSFGQGEQELEEEKMLTPHHSAIEKEGTLFDSLSENSIEFVLALKRLTLREGEVLRLLVRGYRQFEVAKELGVGQPCITAHRKRIEAKLKRFFEDM